MTHFPRVKTEGEAHFLPVSTQCLQSYLNSCCTPEQFFYLETETPFATDCPLIFPPFDAPYLKILAGSLNKPPINKYALYNIHLVSESRPGSTGIDYFRLLSIRFINLNVYSITAELRMNITLARHVMGTLLLNK
jgi:hypothetical protein